MGRPRMLYITRRNLHGIMWRPNHEKLVNVSLDTGANPHLEFTTTTMSSSHTYKLSLSDILHRFDPERTRIPHPSRLAMGCSLGDLGSDPTIQGDSNIVALLVFEPSLK